MGTAAISSNVKLGVGLMVVAMLTIPLVDGIAKHLSFDYSPLFISWARYASATLIILPFAFLKFGRNILPSKNIGAHAIRTVFLVLAMTCYFVAISIIPLTTAVTAYFVGPIIAVVLSVVFLKEQITFRKIASLVLGIIGTLFILKPSGEIELGIVLALLAGFFFALYMLATRQAAQSSNPIKTLVFQCLLAVVLLSPQAIITFSSLQKADLLFFAGMGLFSVISHFLSITAFKYADASTLAPLVYVELIATSIIGYVIFSEVPGIATVIGALLIMFGGLILILNMKPSVSD